MFDDEVFVNNEPAENICFLKCDNFSNSNQCLDDCLLAVQKEENKESFNKVKMSTKNNYKYRNSQYLKNCLDKIFIIDEFDRDEIQLDELCNKLDQRDEIEIEKESMLSDF